MRYFKGFFRIVDVLGFLVYYKQGKLKKYVKIYGNFIVKKDIKILKVIRRDYL